MNVLIIGSGGREHALAWKIAQSPLLGRLFIAPGNPGTAKLGVNVPVSIGDKEKIKAFTLEEQIDLVVIGPEQALADGLSDTLREAGIAVFGPSQAAARIETSKIFSKEFMQRHNIPSAAFAGFSDVQAARACLQAAQYPLVIKASGLAAGKGVLLPQNLAEAEAALDALMVSKEFGSAGDQIIIEECLQGEEVSLLAFSDGVTVRPMPPAQDHKRLCDGDFGPNTGGMGAYAPVSVLDAAQVEQITRTILQPAVDGLRLEGMPYVGVLYAGLMLTENGPQVLEFNARFGDPETQVILPLLESDLLEVLLACVQGKLAQVWPRWKEKSAVCVVMAAQGYPQAPEKGALIDLPQELSQNVCIFHAGTAGEKVLHTAGGRVLGVSAWADTLSAALDEVYRTLGQIRFAGAQYRRDIGQREVQRQTRKKAHSAYSAAGVDIDAGSRSVRMMADAVRSTYDARVLAGIGAFGGLFDAAALKQMQSPVLVASTDGVGTKVKLAAQLGRYASIGEDIVNHCIDDILVQGARPLFFLDYYATAKLLPEQVAELVSGMAQACRAAGIALLGGETAEMPGVYREGEFDVAGTIVGVLERAHLLPHADLCAGDRLVGFRSSGPHTNGYSLIRKIFAGEDLLTLQPGLGCLLGDALLAPHRSYLNLLIDLIEQPDSPVKALAHITGGGFFENIPRVLPENLGALIRKTSWPVPELYRLIQQRGDVDESEMYRVFNMGIGMLAVAAPERVAEIQNALGEECWVIGELQNAPDKKVVLA